MQKIKSPSVAGKFYTSDKNELLAQIKSFDKTCRNDYECSTRAVIVPHAGYVYSGPLAFEGIKYLSPSVKNVFIIAPSHHIAFDGAALSDYDKWSTPLGEIEINKEINKELNQNFNLSFLDEAFEPEHSAEVQVPFIQTVLPNAKIIPILLGKINHAIITDIIDYYYEDPENAFVISSDLSHFYKNQEAIKIDNITADMIEAKESENFNPAQACGLKGISALIDFTKNKKYSLVRVGLTNSSKETGDTSSVVGYGSWILYEGEKNTFLKKYFSTLILELCKESIISKFNNKKINLEQIPEVLNEKGATFVTLEKNNELRGCIGSIVAHRNLIDDLIENAQNAAFSDPRFSPLREDELDDISIAVSLLSKPERMRFTDESDLLNQIRPFVDGIIIKENGYQAVYLPSVWEQLPEKSMFLNSLKIKAGLPPHHFSKLFEAYRFTSEYVKQTE